MTKKDWTKVLGWTGYCVYRTEIAEEAKELKLWVRRTRSNRGIVCAGCGRRFEEAADSSEREVRDLPCFQNRTTVVIELYRVRCPDSGLKTEKVEQLPSKVLFSKRFEEMVGGSVLPANRRRVVGRAAPLDAPKYSRRW